MMNLFSDRKNKRVDTDYLKIESNSLQLKDICIQLDNVSMFQVGDVPMPSVTILLGAFLLLALGIRSGLDDGPGGLLLMLGLVISGVWIFTAKQAYESRCLMIITNSGVCYYILFQSVQFAEQVMDRINKIIRNPEHTQNFYVNIRDNTFHDNSSAFVGRG